MDGGDLLEHLRLAKQAGPPPLIGSSLDTDAKLALFRRLFVPMAGLEPRCTHHALDGLQRVTS
jgi:hypothetical protein